MASQCPLGSGALAGTTYPLDRDFTAEKLGFAAPCANSLDGVSDRDFCIELANAISICMMHLSRLSEEIILWCSWEFKFIELDDAFTTGSSIMPQKKNPDVTELIRGKTGRVYGDLNTLLVMMKGIPLAYNKDMQEDKEAIFDAVDTLELCLKTVLHAGFAGAAVAGAALAAVHKVDGIIDIGPEQRAVTLELGQGQLFQRFVGGNAARPHAAGQLVGIPEGHSLLGEVVGAVGGVDEALGSGPAHSWQTPSPSA